MKKIILMLLVAVIVCGMMALNSAYNLKVKKASDSYIKDRVVMLQGDIGGCSGVEIAALSGKHYILSARHCQKITSDGTVEATLENGMKKKVRIIAVSPSTDLLLLSPADNKVIPIAKKVSIYEHIHTLTHGGMRPTYRTDGEMLRSEKLEFPISAIMDDEDMEKCEKVPGQKIVIDFPSMYCAAELRLNITTAMVIGGSSGGPVLNAAGELVGIVSATTGFFSAAVPLEEIHKFLASK